MSTELTQMLQLAIDAGRQSPCAKSKRGVVMWNCAEDVGTSTAFNGPPPGFICSGSDACRKNCGKLCVHAETRVLLRDGGAGYTDILHVKVVDGVPVASGPPSCSDCSKAMLDAGIQHVWLLHDPDGTGNLHLQIYSAADFHVRSLQACDLPRVYQTSLTPKPPDPA